MEDYVLAGRFLQFCSLSDANVITGQRKKNLGEFSKYLAEFHKDVFAFMVRNPELCIRYFYGE